MALDKNRRLQYGTQGFWLWLLQRFSGLLLVLLVLVHGWFTHFSPIADMQAGITDEVVTFDVVKQRLAQGIFIVLDFALLGAVLYHGLNGVRNILLEWKPAANRQLIVNVGLWTLGIAAFAVGARALLVFIL
jgi:succinate dehydrogenase hydrophobic anchor subunit